FVRVKAVSADAVAQWESAIVLIGTACAWSLILRLHRESNAQNPWDSHVQSLLDQLSKAAKVLRLCAICGKVFRKRGGAGVTCGQKRCKQAYEGVRQMLRNRTRDHSMRRKQEHQASVLQAIGPGTPISDELRRRGIRSARAAVEAFISPTTDRATIEA